MVFKSPLGDLGAAIRIDLSLQVPFRACPGFISGGLGRCLFREDFPINRGTVGAVLSEWSYPSPPDLPKRGGRVHKCEFEGNEYSFFQYLLLLLLLLLLLTE